MSTDMDDFSTWLEEILIEKEMSQADLARRSGLSRQAISAYINQKRISPNEEALKALARALQLPVETVFQKAGVLPESPPETEQQRLLVYLFNQLPADEKEDLLNYLQIKITMLERAGKITYGRGGGPA